MSTLRQSFQQLRCLRQLAKTPSVRNQWPRAGVTPASQRWLTTDEASRAAALDAGDADILNNENAKTLDKGLLEGFDIRSAIKAAPEKPFKDVDRARPVPVSPSYFVRDTHFNDTFIELSQMLEKYESLPKTTHEEIGRQYFMTLNTYRAAFGEGVKAKPYAQALTIVKRLSLIHPTVMPPEVKRLVNSFKVHLEGTLDVQKPIPIDKYGRAIGVGRRKASTARAWVVEGTGEVQINGKPISEVFGRVHDRESAIWALKSTERQDKYNVWALVKGGGTTGQAEALTLAIAKGLLAHEPALKPALRKAGCMTRDPRTVERKKHGHVKARKSPAWVKR